MAWGLPGGLHHDEWAITDPAADLAERNSFEPNIYLRPNHLEVKISYVLYELYARLIIRTPVEEAYAESVDAFLVMSRLVSTLFAIALVVLGYLVARRLGTIAGLTAAVLLAVHPFYVEHSMYATPDVPLTASTMLVILALMRYVAKPTVGNIALASLGIALGVASKYPGAIATIMIAVVITAVAVRDRTLVQWFRHAALAVCFCIGILFAVSPNLFTNASAVLSALRRESRSTHAGSDGLNFLEKLEFYSMTYVQLSGLVLTLLALLGLVIALRRPQLAFLPLGLGVVYLVVLSTVSLHWDRWAAPMFVSFVLLAALATQWLFDRDVIHQADGKGRLARVGLISVAGLSLVALVLSSISVGVRLNAPDTRMLSGELAAELGATEDNTIFEGYTPMSPKRRVLIFGQFDQTPSGLVPLDDTKEFIVLSGGTYNRYFREDKYQDEQEFYRLLRSEYELVGSINSTVRAQPRRLFEWHKIIAAVSTINQVRQGGTTGPHIEFYRIPPPGEVQAEEGNAPLSE